MAESEKSFISLGENFPRWQPLSSAWVQIQWCSNTLDRHLRPSKLTYIGEYVWRMSILFYAKTGMPYIFYMNVKNSTEVWALSFTITKVGCQRNTVSLQH
jgi:hypothetical protein